MWWWFQVCHANPGERARFIRCIYNLLNSNSPAVRYEAAGTLVTLSSAPTAIKVSSYGSELHKIQWIITEIYLFSASSEQMKWNSRAMLWDFHEAELLDWVLGIATRDTFCRGGTLAHSSLLLVLTVITPFKGKTDWRVQQPSVVVFSSLISD